jgi:hypothetical protein
MITNESTSPPAPPDEKPVIEHSRQVVQRFRVRPARPADVPCIISLLEANRADSHLADFLVAQDEEERVRGCAELHRHTTELAELLSVAADPSHYTQAWACCWSGGVLRRVPSRCKRETGSSSTPPCCGVRPPSP